MMLIAQFLKELLAILINICYAKMLSVFVDRFIIKSIIY